MEAVLSIPVSAQQALVQKTATLTEALRLVLTEQQEISLSHLDRDITKRFFQCFSRKEILPPVAPLILWQGCYYLASPATLQAEELDYLQIRTGTNIKILPVVLRSYQQWQQLQQLRGLFADDGVADIQSNRSSTEDIRAVTEVHLAENRDQIKRIQAFIRGALQTGASDIHLEPTPEGLRVRYRVDGVLRNHVHLPPTEGRRLVVALKVMCDMDISESRMPQDGRIGELYTSGQKGIQGLDLRVSTMPCINTRGQEEKVVLRLLRQQNSFKTLEDIGFTDTTLKTYQRWLSEPQGLIIFSGPTGSGKTSTLYTSLQSLVTDSVNISTIENPVEYLLSGITQTQVHEAAGMTFASGLRAILRQDPDIIMVGETRDEDTAKIVIQAALTGHLVFTTLHTNDALGTIPRLKDIGHDTGLISDALLGVVAQRLVRKVCVHCAEPYQPSAAETQLMHLTPEQVDQGKWLRGKGCSFCCHTGYLGREAVIELLDVDPVVQQCIYEGNLLNLTRYLHRIEYHSFAKAARLKVLQGATTIEEVVRVIGKRYLNPDKFSRN
ncbi:MAG: GspE/PulE family protein [Cyanobacteria bacterium P01_H01_bin.121]